MKKGKLIIVIGSSGSGKNTLSNEIILSGLMFNDNVSIPSNIWKDDPEYISYLSKYTSDQSKSMFYATKYVTRELRSEDVGVTKCSVDEMRSKCDVIIPGYNDNDFIGFDMNEIISQIDQSKTPVIVTGFMEALQLILKKFYELGRLDDVFIVGINDFLRDEVSYTGLEQKRYENEDAHSMVTSSAENRFKHSRVFARQYTDFHDILDWDFDNYRMKYATEPDIRREGTVIEHYVSHSQYARSEEKTKRILEFIACDLKDFQPVQDGEIRHL